MTQTIRARLRQTRRRRRLRLLRFLIVSAAVVAALTGLYRYLHGPNFAYGRANISGTNLLTEDDILQMAGSKRPFNVFNVSAVRVQEALSHDVRFRKAEASYKWPSGVLQVYVEEREPALYVANAYRSYLQVDFDGVVMNVTTALPDGRAPLLCGETCGNVYIGDVIANRRVLQLLRFLQALAPEARDRIAEITVDGRQSVTLSQRGSFPIILGSADEAPAKAQLYMTVFNEIKGKSIDAEYIDLTFAKPYIKLKPAVRQ